jgi:hypothetical protein
MLAEHAHLGMLFEATIGAFQRGDAAAAASSFAAVEERLVAHLALEDELLIPPLRDVDPDSAEALAEDHRRIRARLAELGIAVELHAARAPAVEELAALVRAHAHREDALLYRWADQALHDLDEQVRTRRLLHDIAAEKAAGRRR